MIESGETHVILNKGLPARLLTQTIGPVPAFRDGRRSMFGGRECRDYGRNRERRSLVAGRECGTLLQKVAEICQ